MNRNRHFIALSLAATATILSSAVLGAVSEHAGQIAATFDRMNEADRQFGFLGDNCMDCHNATDWAGSLAFDLIAPDEIPDDIEVWEKVINKLQGRMMPPAGQPRPDNEATDRFIAWVESYLDHAAALQPHAGRVGLHRLNRKEYANAVRDLFGVDVDASTLLPADASVDGFDNIAEALRVSPSFLDQSLTAARVVVSQAIGNPEPRAGGTTYRATGDQHKHIAGLPLGTRGGLLVEHYFPADGEYVLNIGNLVQALWGFNQEFTHTLVATLDGERFFELDIGGGEDLRDIDQQGDPAVDEINSHIKNIRFSSSAGPHKLAVTFVQRSLAEFEGTLHAMTPVSGENVISLNSIELLGPYNPAGLSETPAREKIFTCYPQASDQERACAGQIISRIARLAYRGPVAAADMQRLMNIYEVNQAERGFEMGVRYALTAVIASPRFLYRVESVPEGAEPGSIHALSDLELASRLSFFLWSSIPDDELLSLAENGLLSDNEVLQAQVHRMLQDPRAEMLASNFAGQWLNMAKLDEIDPDPALFRDVDRGIRNLFRRELELLSADIFLNNKPVTELLTADYSYLNETLAMHYGIDSVKGDAFRKVPLEDEYRHGLLGKGGILMASSYPDRTSPVLRGAYVLEYILGTPPPLPPPNVEALVENKPGQKQLTVRERLAVHRNNPSCSGCHGFIDPMGFALEGFDAVGRARTIDRFVGSPVDTEGVLPDGSMIHGVNDLRESIMERPQLFVENLAENLLLYALGRPVEARDMPLVRKAVRESAQHDYRFFDIVTSIVGSEQFRFVQAPEIAGQAQLAEAAGQ
jgi:hypothetical protein